uniref:Uncharacterized protein n=1 Tax=Brassica oleracea var. oleracea TaxID=109376 RepID=A0A0D3DVZ3_BRAOL
MEFVGITFLFLDEKVARCSSMYKITDHPFLIRFISLTIIDEVITGAAEINLQSRLDCSTISKCVGQIRYVQGSDLTKETTRVVICLLIDLLKETTITQTIKETTATPGDTKDNPNRHKGGNNISTCSLLLSYENSLHAQCQHANVMEMLFGEFGTFGDGLETRMIILVHKTSSQLSQRPNAAAKPNRWENAHAPAAYVLVTAARRRSKEAAASVPAT